MKLVRRASVLLWGFLAVAAFGETLLISGALTDAPDPEATAAEVERSAGAATSACLANTRQGAASCAHSAWQASSYFGNVSWQELLQPARH